MDTETGSVVSKKTKTSTKTQDADDLHYEFRVWGRHKTARNTLKKLASEVTEEKFEDCYLIVEDPTWNAKVRDSTLKIKQLIAEHKGFEVWSSGRHRTAESAPTPFDELYETLRLDRPQRGKKYNLPKEVKKLDPESGVRAVFVTKHRRRYMIGEIKAEVTDIDIHESNDVVRTLLIEGNNLRDLVKLRKKLGLKHEPNLAMHEFIEAELDD